MFILLLFLIADIEIGNEIYKDVVMDYKALKTGKKNFYSRSKKYQIFKRSEYEAPIELIMAMLSLATELKVSNGIKYLLLKNAFLFDLQNTPDGYIRLVQDPNQN